MKEDHINWLAVQAPRTKPEKFDALLSEIRRCEYVCLTDCLTNYSFGGNVALQMLDPKDQTGLGAAKPLPDAARRTYKINFFRDQWGEPTKPGDVVERVIELPFVDARGKKMSNKAELIRSGRYEKEFIDRHRYTLDDRCCIECGYDDAVWFLVEYGVHYDPDGGAISRKKEISGGPCKVLDERRQPIPATDDKGKPLYGAAGEPRFMEKHVWYWRCKEVPPWDYDKMPSRGGTKNATDGEKVRTGKEG